MEVRCPLEGQGFKQLSAEYETDQGWYQVKVNSRTRVLA